MADFEDQPTVHGENPHIVLGYQLDNLRVFLFAAAELGVAAAAKKLFMTPSAVSRSIHELEKALGLPLFERSSRGLLLTDTGRIVVARGERINNEVQQAIADLVRSETIAGAPSPSTVRSVFFSGRKLQLLILLTATRKLATAATQIGMTQSGASMALARVESSLGAALFQRTKQGLEPLDGAKYLAIHAKRVFAEFRHLLSDLSVESGKLTGWVSLGTSSRGRTLIVPMAIGVFLAGNPEVHVTMLEASFEQMILALSSGELDAVVGVPREGYRLQGLTVEPLFTDRVAVFARTGHPLGRRSKLSLRDLAGQRWILPGAGTPARTMFEECCRQEGMQPPVPAVESADLAVTRQLLLTSDMVAVASTFQFQFEMGFGVLTKLGVPLAGSTVEVALLSRDGAMLSSTALALLEAIRKQGMSIQI